MQVYGHPWGQLSDQVGLKALHLPRCFSTLILNFVFEKRQKMCVVRDQKSKNCGYKEIGTSAFEKHLGEKLY